MTTSFPPGIHAAATRHGITPAKYLALREAGFKWCRTCKEWRPRTAYKPSTSTYDGLRPLCTLHYTPKQPVPIRHGTLTGYSRGCRCTECRKANTAWNMRRRAERAADPAGADRAGHGKPTTYTNYNCRCPDCTRANAERCRAHYRKTKAK